MPAAAAVNKQNLIKIEIAKHVVKFQTKCSKTFYFHSLKVTQISDSCSASDTEKMCLLLYKTISKMTSKAKKQWNHFPAITIRRKTLSHSQHNIVTFPQTYVMRNIIMVFFFLFYYLSVKSC